MRGSRLRFLVPVGAVALVLVAIPIAALTETTAEIRLKDRLGLPHMCLPETRDSPGWRREADLPAPIDEPRAVGVDGRIYLAGGITAIRWPDDDELTEEERARVGVVSSRQLLRFEPGRGRYTRLAPMPAALNHIGFTAREDELYVVGGHGRRLYGGDARREVYRYSIAEDRWEELPPMPTGRGALAVGIIGDKLYAAGGMSQGDPLGRPLATLEVLDLRTMRWSRGPSMPRPREHIAGIAVDGRLLVIGGRDLRTDALPSVEAFDPMTGRWEERAPLPVAAGGLQGALLDSRPIVMGGGDDRSGTVTDAVQRYNLRADEWQLLSPMRTARHGAGVTEAGGRLYAFGGSACARFAASDIVESFRPEAAS